MMTTIAPMMYRIEYMVETSYAIPLKHDACHFWRVGERKDVTPAIRPLVIGCDAWAYERAHRR